MHTQFSLTRGIRSVFQRLFLGSAIIALPAVLATAQAQTADPLGALLQKSVARTQSTSWSPDVSDPIGDLINQAKVDRSNRDASIGVGLRADSPGSQLAQAALNYVGVRYRFGGTSPQGFDCSGLIYYTASKYMGLELPRVSSSMASVGESVNRANLQPGDLVFFNTRGFRNSHVGIYLGNNEFLHAPRSGTRVRVEKMSDYWNKRYNGARRLTAVATAKG